MATDAISLLKQFRSAVESGDQTQVVEEGNRAADALMELSDREAGIDGAARLVVSNSGLDEESLSAAENAIQELQRARNKRAEFGVLLQGLSAGEFDQDKALSVTDSVIDSQRAADQATEGFLETKAVSSLKPILVGIAPSEVTVPKGESNVDRVASGNARPSKGSDSTRKTVETTVENISGNPATGLTVSLETDLPSTNLEPTDVETLPARTSKKFSLSFETDIEEGRYRPQITFSSSEGATEVISFPVQIVGKQKYIGELVKQFSHLEEEFKQLDRKTQRPLRPHLNKVGQLQSDLEELHEQLDSRESSSKKINQRLFTIKKRLQGLESLIGSLKRVSESKRASLLDEVAAIKATIESTRAADI